MMPWMSQSKEDLIFFDESHFYSKTFFKRKGYYHPGAKSTEFFQGIFEAQSVSLLLAIGWNGRTNHLMHPHKKSKGVGEDVFCEFLLECHHICPISSIFVMDNASIHVGHLISTVIDQIFRDGRTVIFQAKYSPDLNPIEYVFGFLKSRAKSTIISNIVNKDLVANVNNLCFELSVQDCQNTIKKIFDFSSIHT